MNDVQLYDVEKLVARSQVGLAFFYGVIFVGIFICLAIWWDKLSKFDVGLLTMFATGAMNQSKDAGNFFFSRQHRSAIPDASNGNGGGDSSTPTVTPKPPAPAK